MKRAKIADIFFSTQGEGIYAGEPQLFVRFYDCMWNCRFCDTSLNAYEKYTPIELYNQIKRFTPLEKAGEGIGKSSLAGFTQEYHSLCLTGGEPLLYKDFLKQFLRLVKYDGKTTYLETNGILAEALAELIDDIDIVAMDLKLPSSTGMRDYWKEHSKFLKVALRRNLFIKMVICLDTSRDDVDQAIRLITRAKASNIPVVLQPNFFELSKDLLARTREIEKYCSRQLKHVEVIPQLHKITRIK
ncbi:MAG: 7-carboxy-7-deazaguanine synthase QueE [Candidatus Omnitrophica bacterium]|nr:7-carboxy-7-deazaguanine synthase QueE [Candidatus Omnitrophota bacterium]